MIKVITHTGEYEIDQEEISWALEGSVCADNILGWVARKEISNSGKAEDAYDIVKNLKDGDAIDVRY